MQSSITPVIIKRTVGIVYGQTLYSPAGGRNYRSEAICALYWEEELNLSIGRNELGHRYYTGYDIQMFLNIRELKNRGLKLSAIRELIPKISQNVPGGERSKIRLLETAKQDEEAKEGLKMNWKILRGSRMGKVGKKTGKL